MKFLKSLFLASLFFSSISQAAIVLKTPTMACTRDLNEWGKASQCQCPEATNYNQKIGECLVGETWPILVEGVIRSKEADTKGVILETKFGRFPLILKGEEIEKLSRVNGLPFEVSGELVLTTDKRMTPKSIIIVDTLSWLD